MQRRVSKARAQACQRRVHRRVEDACKGVSKVHAKAVEGARGRRASEKERGCARGRAKACAGDGDGCRGVPLASGRSVRPGGGKKNQARQSNKKITICARLQRNYCDFACSAPKDALKNKSEKSEKSDCACL